MLGIIILNYKNYSDTIDCIKNIDNTCGIAYRIYVVDNASGNGSYEILKKRYENSKNVTVLDSGANKGYAYGNNVGVKRAVSDGCDSVLISNNDVEYADKAIDKLYDALNEMRAEKVAAVSPKVFNVDRTVCDYLKTDFSGKKTLSLFKPFTFLNKRRDNSKFHYDYKDRFVGNGSLAGCCMLLDSKSFEDVGYFDEFTFLYFEEDILAKKFEMAKFLSAIEPGSEIVHRGGGSTGSFDANSAAFFVVSLLYFQKRYYKASAISFLFYRSFFSLYFYLKYKKGLITKKNYDYFKSNMAVIKAIGVEK